MDRRAFLKLLGVAPAAAAVAKEAVAQRALDLTAAEIDAGLNALWPRAEEDYSADFDAAAEKMCRDLDRFLPANDEWRPCTDPSCSVAVQHEPHAEPLSARVNALRYGDDPARSFPLTVGKTVPYERYEATYKFSIVETQNELRADDGSGWFFSDDGKARGRMLGISMGGETLGTGRLTRRRT